MNRLLITICVTTFLFLSLSYHQLYRQKIRTEYLFQQMQQISEESIESLDNATENDIYQMKRTLGNLSKEAYLPVGKVTFKIRKQLNTFEKDLLAAQQQIDTINLSSTVQLELIEQLNDKIQSCQSVIVSAYANLLQTYGPEPLGLSQKHIKQEIKDNHEFINRLLDTTLLNTIDRLDKAELSFLLTLLHTRIKQVEYAMTEKLLSFIGGRTINCFWRSLNIHAEQCEVKLGNTFKADIGIVEYPIELNPSSWTLTVDGEKLEYGKFNIPVYRKKATKLGWQEFTVHYSYDSMYSDICVKDHFTYRYQVVP